MDDRTSEHGLESTDSLYYSQYRGIVVDTKDPKGLGRILIKVPEVANNDVLPQWSYPNFQQGMFWPPYEGDGVWTTFEYGDAANSNYIGTWYGESQGERSDVPAVFRTNKPGEAPIRRGLALKYGMYLYWDEKEGEETIQLLWTNRKNDKTSAFTFDKNGSCTIATASGRRFVVDEENDQLYYSDVDGNTLLSFSPDKGFLLAYKKGSANANVALMPSGRMSVQSSKDISLSAPSVAIESGSIGLGGTKALFSAVHGEKLVVLLTQLIAQLTTLTVVTPAGTSTPPINAPAIAALTGQLQLMLSLGTKTQ